MREIILETAGVRSVIRCGAGAFEKFAPEIDGKVFVVTDTNVYRIYGGLIERTFKGAPVKVIPAGEKSKNGRRLFDILKAMAEADLKRNSRVVAIGGGVVGDIAGLAASLYMRGVRLVQIPTTLLSQVDSSVGGKTAIDFCNIKNLVGTFYQPQEVIVDPTFLKTLPAREIRCGLGEIIKYAALDKDIYSKLSGAENIKDLKFLGDITADCIGHKARVVTADEHDLNGTSKTLNLGHTTGHALELYFGGKSHGEFVLIGMYYEMYIARKLGVGGGEYFEKLTSLIGQVIKVPAYADLQGAVAAAGHDKKNESERITLIVPEREGRSAEITVGRDEYLKYLTECAKELGAGV